jgi:hypothetical protein
MAYSDFDLWTVQTDFGLTILEQRFFPAVAPVQPDQRLRDTLEENLPLVLARGKEKGRSEWIISPVLTGARRVLHQKVSLFSGDDFNVDPERGLNGRRDIAVTSEGDTWSGQDIQQVRDKFNRVRASVQKRASKGTRSSRR